MGKGLQKVFNFTLKQLNNSLSTLGESGSEVSHFISETRNFSEFTRLPTEVKDAWINSTMKEIEILINNQTFIIEELRK